MYQQLYQYLLQHHKLTIPGIGTLAVESTAAVYDFPNRSVNPHAYSISLLHGNDTPSKKVFAWLAQVFGISDRDAVMQFNDFAFELKKQLNDGRKVNWDQVGALSVGLAGEIRFESAARQLVIEAPVAANKVVREHAEHTVRVGEEEKSSAEMLELLAPEAPARNYWLTIAIILLIIAVIFTGWYFSAHGVTTSAAGNQRQVVPQPSAGIRQ